MKIERIAVGQPKMVVENATKLYETRSGVVHALEKVSLEVLEGEFLCVQTASSFPTLTKVWT